MNSESIREEKSCEGKKESRLIKNIEKSSSSSIEFEHSKAD